MYINSKSVQIYQNVQLHTYLYRHYYSYTQTTYVTRFWKTDWIVTLGLFHFIGPADGYTCTLHIHSAITRLGWLVCFSRVSFADPVNSWLRQWDPWRVLHGRHECEVHPSNRETSINAIKTCLGLWLVLMGLIASTNSPNIGLMHQQLYKQHLWLITIYTATHIVGSYSEVYICSMGVKILNPVVSVTL